MYVYMSRANPIAPLGLSVAVEAAAIDRFEFTPATLSVVIHLVQVQYICVYVCMYLYMCMCMLYIYRSVRVDASLGVTQQRAP